MAKLSRALLMDVRINIRIHLGYLENTDHRPQTSQFKTSLKTFTFDENSLRMALIFPIVYGTGVPTLLFFFFAV